MSKFIVDTTHSEIINKDLVVRIYLSYGEAGYFICADMANQKSIAIGKYDTKDRATEVFDEILRDELESDKEMYYIPR